ncbi:MAG: hypothetical protein JWP27_2665 [Flaviaesturariibacter sp.]|nr:hypothetical protein [Flaviaesturariibacter sp.]
MEQIYDESGLGGHPFDFTPIISHPFLFLAHKTIMDNNTVSLLVAFLALVIALFALVTAAKKPAPPRREANLLPLQLQAYERLVILCERLALPSLISRTASADLSAREMHYVLIENIKQEYDYNASQQIYVSPLAWTGVRNLRDQSMLVINKIANSLPPDARAAELNKQLLEVIMNQPDQALHTMVLEALNAEAKELLK